MARQGRAKERQAVNRGRVHPDNAVVHITEEKGVVPQQLGAVVAAVVVEYQLPSDLLEIPVPFAVAWCVCEGGEAPEWYTQAYSNVSICISHICL